MIYNCKIVYDYYIENNLKINYENIPLLVANNQHSCSNGLIRIGTEYSLSHKSLYNPDYVTIAQDNIPLLIIKIKKLLERELDQKIKLYHSKNSKALGHCYGQLFEYMLQVISHFDLINVYGILSDFQSWKFCWFNHSNHLVLKNQEEIELDYKKLVQDRSLTYSDLKYVEDSKEIKCPCLIRRLFSFLLLGIDARNNIRSCNGITKLHIALTLGSNNKFRMDYFSLEDRTNTPKFKIIFPRKIPNNKDTCFYVVHHYNEGDDGLVKLMCYPIKNQKDVFQLVVVKTIYNHKFDKSSLNKEEIINRIEVNNEKIKVQVANEING